MVLISIGGCSDIKRHEDIISILPDILNTHPNTIYLHLGEGPNLQQEKELVHDLGLNNVVYFIKNTTEVRKYIIASDFYIMPSRFEGIPITAIEALACRIPAIIYDVPGLRDFNKIKPCTTIIPEDKNEIAKAIDRLLKDSEQRNKLVENGYDYVTENFFMPTNVSHIFQLYQRNKG